MKPVRITRMAHSAYGPRQVPRLLIIYCQEAAEAARPGDFGPGGCQQSVCATRPWREATARGQSTTDAERGQRRRRRCNAGGRGLHASLRKGGGLQSLDDVAQTDGRRACHASSGRHSWPSARSALLMVAA